MVGAMKHWAAVVAIGLGLLVAGGIAPASAWADTGRGGDVAGITTSGEREPGPVSPGVNFTTPPECQGWDGTADGEGGCPPAVNTFVAVPGTKP
jgi:hypothetical protein